MTTLSEAARKLLEENDQILRQAKSTFRTSSKKIVLESGWEEREALRIMRVERTFYSEDYHSEQPKHRSEWPDIHIRMSLFEADDTIAETMFNFLKSHSPSMLFILIVHPHKHNEHCAPKYNCHAYH